VSHEVCTNPSHKFHKQAQSRCASTQHAPQKDDDCSDRATQSMLLCAIEAAPAETRNKGSLPSTWDMLRAAIFPGEKV
jgi:hypothetical protein